jgi:hypothetical protein
MKDLMENNFSQDYRLSMEMMSMFFRVSTGGFVLATPAGKALSMTFNLRGSLLTMLTLKFSHDSKKSLAFSPNFCSGALHSSKHGIATFM